MIRKHNEIFELLKKMYETEDSLKLYLYIQDIVNTKIPYENDADMFVFLTTEVLPFFYNNKAREIYKAQLHLYLNDLIYVYPYIDFEMNQFHISPRISIQEFNEFGDKITLILMSHSITRDSREQTDKLRCVLKKLCGNHTSLLLY